MGGLRALKTGTKGLKVKGPGRRLRQVRAAWGSLLIGPDDLYLTWSWYFISGVERVWWRGLNVHN